MRAFLICPEGELRKRFEEAVAEFDDLHLVKRPDTYPTAEGFTRLVRAWAPEAIFISLEDSESASRLCQQLDLEFPGLQRIALAPAADPAAFRLALRLQMRELLASPFEESEIARVLGDVQDHLSAHPASIGCCERFYAFMPAKAGVGASTIAANVHRALNGVPETRSLLADFDLDSGMAGFLFNVDHSFALADALRMSKQLDEESWDRLIKKVGNTDLLLSGAPRLDDREKNLNEFATLLHFLRRNYNLMSADISDSFNDLNLFILREVNHVFLITTPELPALRLARQKAFLLQKLEMGDRASLVVNRVSKRMELSIEDIEETVGLPVVASFPCDYKGVTRAIRDGCQPATLAPALQEFASKLLSKRFREKKKSRYIERFALVPAKYSFR